MPNSAIVLWAISLVIGACVHAGQPHAEPSLLGSWLFEGTTTDSAEDLSENRHRGKLRSLTPEKRPRRVPGMVGGALVFRAAHGTDVQVKNTSRLNPGTGLTITAWIRHDGPITGTAEILGKKGQAKAIVDGYRLSLSKAGRLCFEVGDGMTVSRVTTANRTIKADTWYHVAATFAPGRLRLYLNCRLIVDQEVAAERIARSKSHLVIGNFAGRRNAYPFNGIIDEVNLFAAPLEADAIFALANPDKLQH